MAEWRRGDWYGMRSNFLMIAVEALLRLVWLRMGG
jgi:hypothetical protein